MKARLALAALATMTAVAAQFTTTPAQSVLPTGDCAEPYPVSEVAAGDPVTGLTVSHGTSPEGLTGQVLGVVREDDLPGSEAPRAWLDYLRGGSARDLRRVGEHNAQDLRSLAGLCLHLARRAAEDRPDPPVAA